MEDVADVAAVAGVAEAADVAGAAMRCARMKKRMVPVVLHLAARMIRENLVRESRKKRSINSQLRVILWVIS